MAREEDMKRKQQALEKLRGAVEEAMRVLGESEFYLSPVGSLKLGVLSPSSDLDVLVIGHAQRQAFFAQLAKVPCPPLPAFSSAFAERGLQVLQARGAREIRSVPDALVPVVKMKLCDEYVDVQYSCMQAPLPASFDPATLSDTDLKRLDPKCLFSLNSLLEADLILRVCGDRRAFRTALHFIKTWAQRRYAYCQNRKNLDHFFFHAPPLLLTRQHSLEHLTDVFPQWSVFESSRFSGRRGVDGDAGADLPGQPVGAGAGARVALLRHVR
jgi:hypothetical protein